MIDSERGGKKTKKQSRLVEKELINLVATVVNEKGEKNPFWTRSWRPLGLVQILGGLNIVPKHDVYFPFSFQVPKHMYIDINEKICFYFCLGSFIIFSCTFTFFFFVPFTGGFCSLTLGLYPWLRSARFNKFQQQKNINHSPSFFFNKKRGNKNN